MAAIRVMIVDDSVVVRRVVADALKAAPEIEVVGSAANGRFALEKMPTLRPDVVTMDIEMPEMDGITAVRELRRAGHRQPIIMFSTLTERGAQATFEALAAGASDYMTKPSQVADVRDAIRQVREGLIPRIKALVPQRPSQAPQAPQAPARPQLPAIARVLPTPRNEPQRTSPVIPAACPTPEPLPAAQPAPVVTRAVTPSRSADYDILAVGCSTGGPEALSTFLGGLPANLGVPVVVVQHMPPIFTAQFAARLDRQHPLRVVEADAPEQLRPGSVYIAPGDFHLEVHRQSGGVWTRTTQAPAENFCRPAVDVLFRSVVAAFGSRTLAVVLTGMGSDGRLGAEAMVRAGGSVLVQDQSTSVVWGMPGAVAGAGLAEQILPLNQLAPAVRRKLETATVRNA